MSVVRIITGVPTMWVDYGKYMSFWSGQMRLPTIYECAYEADVRKVGFHFICLGA